MPGVDATAAPESTAGDLERRLAEVDSLRHRVLNVIPHALRTPITTFRGLADALSRASEEDIRATITPALQRLAAQAESLLDDMLVAAGLTTTLPTIAPVPTPVAAVVNDVWRDVSDATTDLEVTGDATVSASPGVLRKIMVHVLDNAVKYGTEPPVVTVEADAGMVTITIDSAGPDLPADEIGMLAEPFFRGERAVMRSAGLGVGLAVARALAEHAGGSLALEARDEGGVVSRIHLVTA